MKGGSEKLGETHFAWYTTEESTVRSSYYGHIARAGHTVASSPEILLDGVVDQVRIEITGRCPRKKKRFSENNTLGSTLEGKEGNDEDEKHPVRGLRRKIGGSYDYGGELPLISKIQST